MLRKYLIYYRNVLYIEQTKAQPNKENEMRHNQRATSYTKNRQRNKQKYQTILCIHPMYSRSDQTPGSYRIIKIYSKRINDAWKILQSATYETGANHA